MFSEVDRHSLLAEATLLFTSIGWMEIFELLTISATKHSLIATSLPQHASAMARKIYASYPFEP